MKKATIIIVASKFVSAKFNRGSIVKEKPFSESRATIYG